MSGLQIDQKSLEPWSGSGFSLRFVCFFKFREVWERHIFNFCGDYGCESYSREG